MPWIFLHFTRPETSAPLKFYDLGSPRILTKHNRGSSAEAVNQRERGETTDEQKDKSSRSKERTNNPSKNKNNRNLNPRPKILSPTTLAYLSLKPTEK